MTVFALLGRQPSMPWLAWLLLYFGLDDMWKGYWQDHPSL